MMSAGERLSRHWNVVRKKKKVNDEKLRRRHNVQMFEELSDALPWTVAEGHQRSKRIILEKAIQTMKLHNTPAENSDLDTASDDGNEAIMPAGEHPPRWNAAHERVLLTKRMKRNRASKLRQQYITRLFNKLSNALPWNFADGPQRSKRAILEKAVQTMKLHNTPAEIILDDSSDNGNGLDYSSDDENVLDDSSDDGGQNGN